jgi:hypothetical protein
VTSKAFLMKGVLEIKAARRIVGLGSMLLKNSVVGPA